jgi:hypothetical protein
MSSIYTELYNAGADVVLNGHDHDYERFAPQDPAGNLDTARGITEFVVGVGGSNFTTINYPLQPNSQTIQNTAFGVLKLSLNPGGYSWKFISVNGSYSDSGTGTCH